MTLIEILLLLLIAAICGSLGQVLVGYSTGGLLASIVVGVIGVLLGLLARTLASGSLVNLTSQYSMLSTWEVVRSRLFGQLSVLLSLPPYSV